MVASAVAAAAAVLPSVWPKDQRGCQPQYGTRMVSVLKALERDGTVHQSADKDAWERSGDDRPSHSPANTRSTADSAAGGNHRGGGDGMMRGRGGIQRGGGVDTQPLAD
ncbi:unnamed protein product [Vitrella brassicaformis CCMP3155]|uniref:Uncharacterized protein n=1 Tax=Vitrella brassicaformis (strain CCMP3155) TaxID=1169540 RepID=A0A0G4EAQ9_VITBC|nr:unnamed protein product [Vitrella brassicaformis CCMP3155]|eukprot:CEL92736.1 unnamed protein product [Vitrella brassicaformis CCMP3155]